MKDNLVGLTDQELDNQFNEAKEELRKLRFKTVTGKLENPKAISGFKKKIARILTLKKEYALGIRKR